MTVPTAEQAPTRRGPAAPLRLMIVAALAGGAVVLGIVAIIGAPLLLLHRQDLPLEQQYGHFAIGVAARVMAGNASNPVANNPRAVAAGRDAFTGSCAVCHGSTGDGTGAFGVATYPPATNLTSHDVVEKSDAELFWITKNGLSFTAMPGFGDQYSDQDIWNIVAYMRSLQNGQPAAASVPSPTFAQLEAADPNGDAVQRGASVYFAEGCQSCHGAVGDAPGNLALRGAGETGAIRRGRPGMPAYGTDRISDAQLADLQAYLRTFAGGSPNREPGGGREQRGG
ncbi:MAG: c-type cytochrome [Chloroflexi bacterium]|nr:c-type cytochrome [Chloroflexota bacterium]